MKSKCRSRSSEEFWQIDEIVQFIRAHSASKVCLQFSDETLGDFLDVTDLLKRTYAESSSHGSSDESTATEPLQVFTMADSTFAPCCVDEVTAMRVDADVIVHFGNACFSGESTKRIPSIHIPTRRKLQLTHLRSAICSQLTASGFATADGHCQLVFVLFEQCYAHLHLELSALFDELNAATTSGCQFVLAKMHSELRQSAKCQKMDERSTDTDDLETAVPSTASDTPVDSDTVETEKLLISEDTICETDTVAKDTSFVKVSGFRFERKYWQQTDGEFAAVKKAVLLLESDKSEHCDENWFFQSIVANFSHCALFAYRCPPPMAVSPSESSASGRPVVAAAASDSRATGCGAPADWLVQVTGAGVSKCPAKRIVLQRYAMIEVCKKAEVIGIVICTVVVCDYLEIVAHLKRLITAAGKKWYLLYSGKPNPCKLANFQEMDVFVMICCPLSWNQLSAQQCEYFAPLVSPFECDMALNPDSEWTGHYSTHFDEVLRKAKERKEESAETAHSLSVVHSAGFSVVHSRAARFLQKSTFTGQTVAATDLPPAAITEGLTGIAAHYTDETLVADT